MTQLNLKFAAAVLITSMAYSTHVCAFSTSPEKPKTASVSLGAEFASGSYGTDTTTRSVYLPLIATWSPNERFDVGIEVPFIYQSSSNVTTSLFTTSQSATAAKTTVKGGPGGNSTAGLLQQPGVTTASGATGVSGASGSSGASVSGMGDIIARLGVIAVFEGDAAPQVRPSLFVKFPTASRSEGLGTGEFDAGVGLEATKWLGSLHLTAEAFYNYQGKVDGFDLKNYVSYTAGIGYLLLESVEPMLIIKGASAPSGYSGSLLEARARVIWAITDTTSLDLYGSRGISDSSPDYGGGIAAIYSF